jgi:hypothetical protein
VDTTLTVMAGNLYRLLARSLKRYEHMTPERIHGHFIDTTGNVHVGEDHVTVNPHPAHLHPGSAPSRLRRDGPSHPVVGWPSPTVHVPLNTIVCQRRSQDDYCSENRG